MDEKAALRRRCWRENALPVSDGEVLLPRRIIHGNTGAARNVRGFGQSGSPPSDIVPFPCQTGDVFGVLLFAELSVNRADLLCRLTGDMSLAAVIGEEAPVVLRGDTLAEAIARGKSDWHTLQKNSVSIRRYKIKEWNLKEIAAGVYRRTWGYDDFLGYMHEVINVSAALFC